VAKFKVVVMKDKKMNYEEAKIKATPKRCDNCSEHICVQSCMEAQVKLEDNETKLSEAYAMILRLVVVRYRQGWEEGQSEQEVFDRARDFLFNVGLDLHNDREACEAVLKEFPGVSLTQCRSNQEKYESLMDEVKDDKKEIVRQSILIDELREDSKDLAERLKLSELTLKS